MPAIQALVFDVFGTLVDWRNEIARESAPFLARHGRGDIDPIAFAEAWRACYQPSMETVRSGARPYVRLDVLHRENLSTVLAQFGFDEARLDQDELAQLNRGWHRLAAWPDVVPALLRLKTRYILAPMSNGNLSMMVRLARHAGFPWDAVLGAELAGDYKPAAAVYQHGPRALDLPPEAVCMVAAHNGDLRAARECGLSTAFVPRPTEYGPKQTKDFRAEEDWTVVARDFEDLADQLLAR